MRKSPSRLALFFILITITRVALFVAVGLKIGWLGYAFAVGLAVGVYVTAYFVRFPQTRLAAGIGLAVFGLADLFFNEAELIRSLSAEQLISPDANFIGIGQEFLRYAMQISAIVFGAFPTIAAAILGWLQSGAERIVVLKSKAWFGQFGVAIAAKAAKWFPETMDTNISLPNGQLQLPGNSGNGNIVAIKARWEDISASEKAEIAGKTVLQIIAKYGGSARRARMWKQWIEAGK